ncbi:Ig-like domain-containing protein [Mycolicibacterium gilvum]|uniref:Ig-like domain-containing protein n=1 Tax=Mycolicibacterium gilvum TaxID=1804 RepID=UPI00404641A2
MALGIGAAISVAQASSAWADDADGGSQGSAPSAVGAPGPASSSGSESPVRGKKPGSTRSRTEQDDRSTAAAPKVEDEKSDAADQSESTYGNALGASKQRSTSTDASPAVSRNLHKDMVTADDDVSDVAVFDREVSTPQAHVQVSETPRPAEALGAHSEPVSSAVSVTTPPPVELVPVAVAATSASLVQPGTGGVPIGASAVWVMAAAARREGGVSDAVPVPAASEAAISNSPPAFMNPTVGTPNSSTGKVRGKVVAADVDKDKLKYSVTGAAGKGSVKVSASTGAFTYTPTAAARHEAARLGAAGSARMDSFTVTVSDGKGASATQTVSVIVAPKNAIPKLSVRVGKPATGTAIVSGTVTARDSDKDPLTFSAPAKTDKGTVVVNASTGAFTYTPTQAARIAAGDRSATSASRTDTFALTVSDGHGGSVSKSVKVTIAPANAAPTEGKATVTKTDSATGAVTGTLSAVDANGDKITYSGPGSTSKGTLVVKGSAFTYTPTAVARHAASATTASAADKRDTFTITASDGKGGTLPITVTVTVAPKNAELGNPKTTVGQPNTSTGLVEGSVTATDADGDTIKYSAPSNTAKGSVIVNSASGAFVYQPSESAARQAGLSSATAADKQDTFTIAVDDGHGSTRQVTVTVTIAGRNTPPAAGAVTVNNPDGNAVVTGAVTASDANGDPLSFSVGANPGKGTVSLASNGTFTYTPNASARQVGVASSDSFTVNVSDGKAVTAIGVTVTVAALPAPPPPPPPVASWRQVTTPNFAVSAQRGWCLKFVDDTVNAPSRSATAQLAFNREQANGNITGGDPPVGVWAPIFFSIGSGQYAGQGHVAWAYNHGGGRFEIRDSETQTGARAVYTNIGQVTSWFGSQNVRYLGWSTWVDGRQILQKVSGPSGPTNPPANSGTKKGTATVITQVNVRNDPSTNGPIIDKYSPGQTFNYDSWVIGNGFYWLSYVSYSGVRRYVAESTLDGSTVYVRGGVFH